MRTDVATLVVTVNGQAEPHQLGELRLLISEHGGEVSRPVLVRVGGAHCRPDPDPVTLQVPVPVGCVRYGEGWEQGPCMTYMHISSSRWKHLLPVIA